MELGREATFRLLVLHYFQRGDQAFSTGFPTSGWSASSAQRRCK